jgi:exopolysaccharide biosynthesis polyprenyl glycosylphosphotransferase
VNVQTRRDKALRNLHLIIDAVTILASMVLATGIHAQLSTRFPVLRELPEFPQFASLAYAVLPLWLILVVAFRLHLSFERGYRPGELLLGLLKLHLSGALGLSAIQFLTQSVINRSFVGLFLISTLTLMYLERVALGAWVRYQYERGQTREHLLLVGRPSQRMSDFLEDLKRQPLAPEVVGYLEAPQPSTGLSDPPPGSAPVERIGGIEDLDRVLHARPVDHVMFFPPSNRPEELRSAVSVCEDVGVRASFSVNLVQVARAAPRITSVYDHPFVTFDVAPKRPEWLALKYGLDPMLAAALIVLLSPVFIAISLTILLTMGRPVLFSQPRAGLYGRPFRMLKFRSMIEGAEHQREALTSANEMSGPVFKIGNDPRVTPLGRFLRRSSLDELPQLFNVLTGAMSLVGPRPLPTFEHEQIRGWQRRRLSMKPGITGLWQVSGRSNKDFEEWMMLDLQYIDEWSLLLDVTLLLRTIPAVLFARGAR